MLVAAATATGRSALAVVRLTGPGLAEVDADEGLAAVGGGEVEAAVAVEVGDDEADRLGGEGVAVVDREAGVAVAAEDLDRALEGVVGEDVEVAVAVEVGDSAVQGPLGEGDVAALAEAAGGRRRLEGRRLDGWRGLGRQ